MTGDSDESLVTDTPGENGVGEALDRVVDATQAVFADQVRLTVLEAHAIVARAIEAGGFVLVSSICLSAGWIALMAAFFLWLRSFLTPAGSALVLAMASVIPGAVAARAAVRRLRRVD